MTRKSTQRYLPFIISGIFFAAVFICSAVPVFATWNMPFSVIPDGCVGPYPVGQHFTASAQIGSYSGVPYFTGPAPKNNQFFCSYNAGDHALGSLYQYRCAQESSGRLHCDNHYTNPAVDFYDCNYFGTSPFDGNYVSGVIFDNCTHSVIAPTVVLTVASAVITAGNSTTLSWTVANATSCTSSWAGAISPTSGSQSITPPVTTVYSLTCVGPGGTTGPISRTVTVNPPSDTTPPTDPSGLSAGAASTSQIDLLWSPSTDSGGSGLAGYTIERCSGSGCTNFMQIGVSGVASFSDTGLAPATSYTYRVRAYDNALPTNRSNYSGTASDTTWTPPDSTPPTPFTLSGTSSLLEPTINLNWNASTDPSGILNYRVYRENVLIATLGNTVLAYADTGLAPSTVYHYYVVATDGANNLRNSNPLTLATSALPDTTAPTFTFTLPASVLLAGTTSATLAGTTMTGPNPEQAICRFSTNAGDPFSAMTSFSQTTLNPTHSRAITGLTDGTTYTYYVRCQDAANNESVQFSHMFQVSSPVLDTAPPVISGGTPIGTLVAGTATAAMNVVTNENAYCRYNQGSDIGFGTMTNTFLVTGTTFHSISLTGLTNGTSYTYFVRCEDSTGNRNTSGYLINFSVATPANMNPVAMITASETAPRTVSADGTGSFDTDGSIILYTWAWGDSTPDTSGPSAASHTYVNPGSYTIRLTVYDNQGGWGQRTHTIVFTPPPASSTPEPTSLFCAPFCTTDADCSGTNVCSLSGICIAPPPSLDRPIRTDGYLRLPDGTMGQAGSGAAVFPSSTQSVVMSLETDAYAECQYSTSVNTPYGANVMSTFTNTGATTHAVTLTGITGTLTTASATTDKEHTYYVRCKNSETGEVNTSDYAITFTIAGAEVLSGWPRPYTCLVNKDFVRSSIPYLFDICIPQ